MYSSNIQYKIQNYINIKLIFAIELTFNETSNYELFAIIPWKRNNHNGDDRAIA